MRKFEARFLVLSSALGLVAACGSDAAKVPANQQGANLGETCADVSCGEQGMCASAADGARCVCSPGVVGEHCEQCAPGFVAAQMPARCVAVVAHTRVEPAGANCAHGGVAAESGGDLNGNGKLDANEVTDSEYTCATDGPVACEGDRCECTPTSCGGRGACTVTDRGATCLCDAGYVGTACDTCSDGFIRSHDQTSCIRPTALTADIPEPRGARCPQGGVAHERGLDLDDDGQLETSEVQSTDYVCNTPNVRAGDVTVGTQAELDDLESVTEISGSLSITAEHITSLAPLAKLSRVGGSITISNNKHLASLAGLESLVEVGGSLTVGGNASLASVSFPLLGRVNNVLSISDAPLLTSIDLGELRTIGGGFSVSNVAQLQEITGGALFSVGTGLNLSDAPVLQDISAFDELDAVGQTLSIQRTGLVSLASFAKVAEVGGLVLSGNSILTTAGFDNLHAVTGSVSIGANAQLATVAGFPALYQISGGLSIDSNPALTSIAAFPALLRVDGGLAVTSNTLLASVSGVAKLATIGGGGFTFSDLPALATVDAFAGLTSVWGNFTIANAPVLSSMASLSSLTRAGTVYISATGLPKLPFDALATVDGAFVVDNNDALTTFGSLSQLQTTNGFTVTGNALLRDLGGEWPLVVVVGELDISDNPQLATLPDAPLLTGLSALRLVGNLALRGGGFTGLTLISNSSVGYEIPDVGGAPLSVYANIVISGNDALRQVDFLSHLTSTGSLVINGKSLEDLDALSSLTTLDQLTVVGNPALVSMDGALHVSSYLSSLLVQDNPALKGLVFSPAGRDANGNPSWVGSALVYDNASIANISFGGRGADTVTLSKLGGLKAISALGLTTVNNLVVSDNAALTGLSGLSGANISTLTVENNPSLVLLAGLAPASLSSFSLSNNAGLKSLAGLSTPSIGSLSVTGNAALESFEGMAVPSIYYLYVTANPALKSLLGLAGTVFSTLSVTQNPALAALDGLTGATIDTLTISDNAALTSLAGLAGASVNWFGLTNNASLASLAGLSGTISSFTINQNPALLSLEGPSELSVSSLTVMDNPVLTSLSGLESVVNLSSITLSRNAALKNLVGLPVASLYRLQVDDNDALENLEGIGALTYISDLYVTGNDALTASGTYAGKLGYLTVTYNPHLPTCALNGLKSALDYYWDYRIYGNDDATTCN